MASECSGRCSMNVEGPSRGGKEIREVGVNKCRLPLAWLLGCWVSSSALLAAEAPLEAPELTGVPVAAEAAYQTDRARSVQQPALDEAVFTDITPLTVPDQAIRLPPDQEE